MANTRILNSQIWEDEFFTSLQLFDRLLWIGLITSCADDQGRLQDNAALIRSKVFPTDDIHLESIDNSIRNIEGHGKIARYAVNGKRLIQVVNWWKHQNPRWAGKSIFPAPPGWVDRERYHTSGNKIAEKNWSSNGGYLDGYIAPYTINDVNSDVNSDVDVNGDVDVNSNFQQLKQAFVDATGITEFSGNPQVWVESLKKLDVMGMLPEDMPVAVGINIENNYALVSPKSILNTAKTAIARRVNGGVPARKKSILEENQEVIRNWRNE